MSSSEVPEIAQASEYLARHRILELFKTLTHQVLLEQPADPVPFLIAEIEKIKAGKATPLFSGDDLEGVFTTFDVIGRGSITSDQYQQAMISLGVDGFADAPPSGTLDLTLFKQLAEKALKRYTAALGGR